MSKEGKDVIRRILDLLIRESYTTTKQIAKKLGISRNTASKYLTILSLEGKISYKKAGPSKVRYLIPTPTITEPIDERLERIKGIQGVLTFSAEVFWHANHEST